MMRWRLNFIAVFFAILAGAVIVNLFRIQVINYKYWSALAQGQQNKFEDFAGERGEIFLEGSSFPVATNRDSFFVYLSSAEIKDAETTINFLSGALLLEKDYIAKKLENKENLFNVLKEDLSDSEIKNIKEQNLPGIYLKQKRKRFYPQESLAANVLGFVDADRNGQYGVEGYYNDSLFGEAGMQKIERGPYGFLPFLGGSGALGNGSQLNLTLDYNIQFMAEKLLSQAGEKLGAESGQIIVADPKTGKIAALANYPGFNPNQFSKYAEEGNLDIFQNAATQKIFEPGSVLKPITMAIGLEEGKITPQTTYTDVGFVKFGNSAVYNYDGRKYGKQTMTGVLEKSINTGAVFVEELIPHNVFLDYLAKFGFFEKTGIDLTEVYSENNELKKGYEINFATAAFGQGIEITPIQLVRAFSAIANGGNLVAPYVVNKNNEISEPVISQKTASQVTAMMVSVVENGYGKAAKIPGYYIAGKTGTAQVPEGGKYSAEKTIQSFIGFAPAFSPKFVILVKLDNPKAKTAEYSAIPVFHELAKYIINYWQIAPDYQE